MQRAEHKGKKVFVGLSGGVDSSVAAALLLRQGYAVVGVFIKVWQPDFISCPWQEDRLDAMRVCAHLGIPFLTFDFEEIYERDVGLSMVAEYEAGRTPNPDVLCNKYVKFGAFLKEAQKLGADYIATGHYAHIRSTGGTMGAGRGLTLTQSADANKDQTYFLWTMEQKQLQHILFPVGMYTKSKVRTLARTFGLVTADKKDSQGICFLGKVNMRSFLKNYISEQKGDVLNEQGDVIGFHEGAHFYTIGQRHGFTITKKGTHDTPYYVIGKNIGMNTIRVAHRNKSKMKEPKERQKIILRDENWITGERPLVEGEYQGRIRHRQSLMPCTVVHTRTSAITVSFAYPPQAVAQGQSCVLYNGDECLGGGIIA